MQLTVGYFLIMAGIITFPDNSDLFSARFKMPINTVDANVDRAAFKPANKTGGIVIIHDRMPRFSPM